MAQDPLKIDQRGERNRRLHDHVHLVAGVDSNGQATFPTYRSDGAAAGTSSPATASANFNRPADTTAYTSGDLVANSTTAGSVAALGFTAARVNDAIVRIRRVRVKKTDPSLTNAAFRVHFFNANPIPPTNGDNGAIVAPSAGYIGSVDVTVGQAFTDGAQGAAAADLIAAPATGTRTIYALIEARGAYTPVSGETFTVTLELDQY